MVKIIENGTAYFLMDDLEGKPPPLFLVQHPHIDPEKIVQGWIWIDWSVPREFFDAGLEILSPLKNQFTHILRKFQDPWNIPQTLNHLFMKEILSYWYFRVPRVCSRGLLEFS